MSSPQPPASGRRNVTVRRAPKYVPFLVLGALLGFALAAALAYGVPGDQSYDAGTVFGFFLVPCAAGGAVLGAVVALVLDRLSLRRAQQAVVEPVPDSVPEPGQDSVPETGPDSVPEPGRDSVPETGPETGGGFDGATGTEPRP